MLLLAWHPQICFSHVMHSLCEKQAELLVGFLALHHALAVSCCTVCKFQSCLSECGAQHLTCICACSVHHQHTAPCTFARVAARDCSRAWHLTEKLVRCSCWVVVLQHNTLMQSVLLQVLRYDQQMYTAQLDQMQLPVLLPSLQYCFDFRIRCVDPNAGIGNIKVLLHSSKSPVPLLVAVVKMPLSEMEEE